MKRFSRSCARYTSFTWGGLSVAEPTEPVFVTRSSVSNDPSVSHSSVLLGTLLSSTLVSQSGTWIYIRVYPAGVRENGGQYTHAAIWSVLAFAALGDGDKAGELFSLLHPITHASTPADVYRYKVEPDVADIYAESLHVGRGGWTWYTGSAGWMYRAGIE